MLRTTDYYRPVAAPTLLYLEDQKFDEGIGKTGLFVPVANADYTIDIDPPSKLGKVRQRLRLRMGDAGVVQQIDLFRKHTGEILLPEPNRWSAAEWAFLIVTVLGFSIFSATLAVASDQGRSA